MIARVSYEQAKRDIDKHALDAKTQLTAELTDTKHAQTALRKAYVAANNYHTNVITTIFTRLRDVGNEALDHYAPELTESEKTAEINLALDYLIHNKYYGLTLTQRLKQSNLILRSNIKRSSVVGVKFTTRLDNIARVFSDTYPFGAHKNWDKRLFLAEAVRLEHLLARNIAIRKSIKLIRWTLSSNHAGPDICDQLANAVDKDVETYMTTHNFKGNAGGVYFLDRTPAVPHVNCQCVVRYLKQPKKPPTKSLGQRTLLLARRILRTIFK